jgi:hypothetical protein
MTNATIVSLMAAAALLGNASIAQHASGGPAVIGLDHIPIAVRDLEAAAKTYRALGFSLKPGRPHQNGIRNQHVKFPDGTELELITAPEARDPLTTKYRRHLENGDGPAFLALFVPDNARAPRDLHPSLDYLFFGPRNASPTDRPEHFAHENTASSLISVWLAGEEFSHERTLFTRLGASIVKREVNAPGRVQGEVAQFPEGEVLLLPASHQRVKGRRIVGATLRVRRLSKVRQILEAQRTPVTVSDVSSPASVFVAAEHTHGIWLEFRQEK